MAPERVWWWQNGRLLYARAHKCITVKERGRNPFAYGNAFNGTQQFPSPDVSLLSIHDRASVTTLLRTSEFSFNGFICTESASNREGRDGKQTQNMIKSLSI